MKSGQHLKLPKSELRQLEDNLRRQARMERLKIDIKVKDNGDDTVDTAWTVSDAAVPATWPRVFISHRHKDKDVAEALVHLLQAAFYVEKEDIRCTSVQPYVLPKAERTPDRLRAEISHARAVLGILTPDTMQSSYVLLELGAAWGQNVRFFPLLAKGATPADIPTAISDLQFVHLAKGNDCHQLIDDVEDVAGFRRRHGVGAQIRDNVDDLVKRAGGSIGGQAKRLSLKITNPTDGDTRKGRDFVVEGGFNKTSPRGSFRVFITNVEETSIWPQSAPVEFHKSRWKTKATLLEEPPNEAYVQIAEIKEAGKLLYDYYQEVGEKTKEWIPLSNFTPDTKVYHKVKVRNGYRKED